MEHQDNQFFKFNIKSRDIKEVLCGFQRINIFTDCSLVSSDGRAIEVHRTVLSSCSEFLARILLRRISDAHPVLVFGSLMFEDLSKVVEFMYKGELTIEEDQLDGFWQAVETLKLDGVADGWPAEGEIPTQKDPENERRPHERNTEVHTRESSDSELETESEEEPAVTSKIVQKKKPTRRASVSKRKKGNKVLWNCIFCDKKLLSSRGKLTHQKECPLNPDRVMYECRYCKRTFTRKTRMTAHERTHNFNPEKENT